MSGGPGAGHTHRPRDAVPCAGMAREIADDVATPDELREFARAGEVPSEADPAFEENLRQRLWRMLRRRLARPGEGDPLD